MTPGPDTASPRPQIFSIELARRLKDRRVQAYAVHPGLILTTSLANHMDFNKEVPALLAAVRKNNPGYEWKLEGYAKTDSQGSASALLAALDPDLSNGSYVEDCAVGVPMAYAVDPDNARKLWAYSEGIVGQKFDL